MHSHFDLAIIGGGIVGLATAYHIQQQYPDLKIIVLEKEHEVGTHQTHRNSGVIHSGIYYKPGSAKATNCIRGYQMLLDFCQANEVPFDICGKVIVATDEREIPTLEGIYQRGVENGLTGLKIIDAQEVREVEPHCRSVRAIRVPQAGITDFHLVAKKLVELYCAAGGEIITGYRVDELNEVADHVEIRSAKRSIKSQYVITCAGLYADTLARMAGLKPPHQIVPFRGEFYQLVPSAEHLVRGLIYPVPDVQFPFLGVHLTKRIHGGIEAGPNAVLAFRREGYKHLDIDIGELLASLGYRGFHRLAMRHWRKGFNEMYRSFSPKAFLRSAQQLIPELKPGDLKRSRTGVRAQALDRDGNLVEDYVVLEQDRIVHVLNAPSPAATSCLSIGLHLAELLAPRITAAK